MDTRHQFLREKRVNGLFFGLLAGFWFGVGVWAIDAALLLQAHADLPWLKLAIGTPFMIVLGGVAGWVTARLDNAMIGALIWSLTGAVFVWIASHVPFQGLTFATGLLDPQFAGLEIYPFVESARMRMNLLYFVVGALTAIAGGFQLFFVESATSASSIFSRFFKLMACFVIFVPLGLIVDNLINTSLRAPIVATADLIQFAREVRTGAISVDKQREMGVRALRPLGELIDTPFRTILGDYDPQAMEETRVYLDFGGEWATCSVLGNRPMTCFLSAERYLRRLACLIKSGDPSACRLRPVSETHGLPEGVFARLDKEPLKYGIISQRGTTVFVIAEDAEGDQVRCMLYEAGDIYLDSCTPLKGGSYHVALLPPTATRSAPAVATPTPAAETGANAPKQAWINPEELDLTLLKSAPLYTISLEISADLSSYQSRAQVDITNNETISLDELYFHLLPNGHGSYGNGSLNVEQVRIAGKEPETALSVGDSVMMVVLPETLPPGERVQVEMEFRGVVPQDFGGSATPAGYGIFNYSEGVLALSGWYPILAVYDDQGWNLDPPSVIGDSSYSDTGFYSVDVTLPEDLIVAATGVQVGAQALDGKAQLQYESGPARDFFLVASPDFQVTSQSVGETAINSYYLEGDEQGGRKALSVASDSLKVYNEKFGPYPFTELDVVEAPMRNALGVEFPGIVLIGAKLYESPETPDFEVTVAHETAHQWWYSVVGNDVFDEPWLDEALATYSSGLFYEFTLGPQYSSGLQSYWQERYTRLVNDVGDDLVTGSLAYFEGLNRPAVYGGIVYVKGALFFTALRAEIGDQAFFAGLQNYYRSQYFRIAQADDLLSAFEDSAGRGLDDFYRQWLYSKE